MFGMDADDEAECNKEMSSLEESISALLSGTHPIAVDEARRHAQASIDAEAAVQACLGKDGLALARGCDHAIAQLRRFPKPALPDGIFKPRPKPADAPSWLLPCKRDDNYAKARVARAAAARAAGTARRKYAEHFSDLAAAIAEQQHLLTRVDGMLPKVAEVLAEKRKEVTALREEINQWEDMSGCGVYLRVDPNRF